MQYMLLIHSDPSAWSEMSEEEIEAVGREYFAFAAAIREEGIRVDGNPLQGREHARTVRVRDGRRIVADGPFAETKELIGGYYVVECATLEDALDTAARVPGARFGAVEVRPLAQMYRHPRRGCIGRLSEQGRTIAPLRALARPAVATRGRRPSRSPGRRDRAATTACGAPTAEEALEARTRDAREASPATPARQAGVHHPR